VRDSPDYRTLKVSVFNDDKKTDLIGECTIRLDTILVPGGGTDDGWRGLKCKDKYAGEILVELTFWDLRPKQKKREDLKKSRRITAFEEIEPEVPFRKLGGAREMGSREKAPTVKRRPLPSSPNMGDPSSGEERRKKEEERRERRATRRSKNPHRPDAPRPKSSHYPSNQPSRRDLRDEFQHHLQPSQRPSRRDLGGEFQQTLPQPRERRHREHRGSRPPDHSTNHRHSMIDLSHRPSMMDLNQRHSMAITPAGHDLGGRPEIFDPGDYVPPAGRNDEYQMDPYQGQYQNEPPPPPPPAHRSFQGSGAPSPMDHSPINNGPPELPLEPDFQNELRHFQSIPAFPQPTLNHQRSFDPRGLEQLQQFHQLQQFTPTYPQASFHHQQSPQHSQLQLGVYDQPPYEDDLPPLAHVPTPVSSNPSSRDGPQPPDGLPPPPPPHRKAPAPPSPLIEEPNWDNHRPKTMEEEHGLPSYESLTAADRRASVDVAVRSGIPLPPSLIPGIGSDLMGGVERRQLLQIEAPPPLFSRPSTNYHRPQVEEVQDIQLYKSEPAAEARIFAQHQQHQQQHQLPPPPPPQTLKKKHSHSPPMPLMVKPVAIHGERDSAVPVVNPGPNAIRKASVLNLRPERKPVPAPERPPLRQLSGIPFGPDSYDAINPNPVASLDALARHAPPERMIVPGSNKVYDPSDVLLPETFAPEPEPKRRAPRPPPPVPVEHRRERIGRSVSPAAPRGPRLSLPAPPPPVPAKQVSFEKRRERNSIRASKSMAALPGEGQRSIKNRYSMNDASGGMVLFDPNSERERERQAERERAEKDARALVPAKGHDNYGYRSGHQQSKNTGMEVGYYGRGNNGGGAPPPVPAKIPLQSGRGSAAGISSREELALSQELSLISIGAGGVGGGTRRRGRY